MSPRSKATSFWLFALLLLLPALTTRAAQFSVSTAAEISTVASFAQPGDTLVMQDGVWNNADVLFSANGTAAQPITLRAATLGRVHLTGQSRLRLSGNYLVVDGLTFTNGYRTGGDVIAFRENTTTFANHSRLTNCAVIDYNPPNLTNDTKWVSLYGVSNRVENCYLKGKANVGATLVVWVSSTSNAPNHHVIARNHFGPRPVLTAASNGGETIRVGTSEESMNQSRTVVEDNFFLQCNGDAEYISSKSCGNSYRRNTFIECEGALTLRHGNGSVVEGNYFFGNRRPLTGGVRVVGEDHRVFNNYFQDLAGTASRGPLVLMQGLVASPLNGYFQVKRATVAFNTFVNCTNSLVINLSGTVSGSPTTLPVIDSVIANNVVRQTAGRIVDLRVATAGPEIISWESNILFGTTLGMATNSGTLRADPLLVTNLADALWRPATNSPALGAAAGLYAYVTQDMEGDARPALKDIGADQFSLSAPASPPLTANAVGPLWQRAPGTALAWANPASLTYGTPLGAVQLNSSANAAGMFAYSPAAGTVLDAGVSQVLTVVFTPSDLASFNIATQTVTITVTPATPTIIWSNPAPIVHGAALSATQLNATVNASGSFQFIPPAGTVLSVTNGQPLTVFFTPENTNNFLPASRTVFLNITRSAPVVTWPAPAPIEQGTPLSGAQLNATASVSGTFAYTPTTNAILTAQPAQPLVVTFTPDDLANFLPVTRTNFLNVRLGGKTVPLLTWPAPAPVLSGSPLGALQLNATANVPGTFAYTPPVGTVLPVGNAQWLSVIFTPADSATYATLTNRVLIDVGALSSNALVRVAYLVPQNRTGQAHAIASLQQLLVRYQQWFADQMEVNGFGRKTFVFETEPDGVTPFIHELQLSETDAFLRADIYGGRVISAVQAAGLPVGAAGQMWWLIPETHREQPDGAISGGFGFGHYEATIGTAGGWAISGSDRLALFASTFHTNAAYYDGLVVPDIGPFPLAQDVSFPWFEGETFSGLSSSALGLGLHNFGEAFGLNLDFRNDENFNGNLMGFGFRGLRGMFYPKIYPYNSCGLSYASALALDVNPFFNAGRPVTDLVAPHVEIQTSGDIAPFNGLLQIDFLATDNQALHAALLTWETDEGFVIADELPLTGTSVQSSFLIPYFNAERTNRYRLTVFDQQGLRHTAETTILPQATLNRSPQPFISALPIVAGLGQDIVFNASATFDPEFSANLLEIQWDFDGDGNYDTVPTTDLVVTNRYFTIGSRLVRARVTDPAGATAVSAPIAVNVTVCLTALSPLTRFHGFGGSAGTIEVEVGPKCEWSVVNTNDWVTINSGASGSGPGVVNYQVLPNPIFAERNGYLSIGDNVFLVRQHPLDCNYSLSPPNRFHGFGLGTNSFKVTSKADCAWHVINTNSWITITAGASGVATGNVFYALTANRTFVKRVGHLNVQGEQYTVTQWGTNCEVTLSANGRSHSESPEFGTVNVTTAGGCTWQVINTNDWILVTTLDRGTNSGSFTYLVGENVTTVPRTGNLTLGAQVYAISQGACSYSLAVSNRLHTYLAQTGTVVVTAGAVCAWTVSNTNPWITLLPPPVTSGSQTLKYVLTANPTSNPRTATFQVAGFAFRIEQTGKPCLYELVADEASFPFAGGTGAVVIRAEPSCFWSVANLPPWISVTSGGSGEATGLVAYAVSPNTGAVRSTTFTVGGQDFYVVQASAVRDITVLPFAISSGQTNCLAITIDAKGGENSVAFSLCFDTNLIAFTSAALQSNSANATLTISTQQVLLGRVGFTLAMPVGQTMTPGFAPQLRACFRALNVFGRPVTTLALCDTPVVRQLKNTAGTALPASFHDGLVNIFGLCSLAESLDNTNLNFIVSGSGWSCQTNDTHDLADAAVSGVTPHSGEALLETTVTGPGVLNFWWKVSSQPDSDRLRFYLDGIEQLRISGEVDWEFRTFNLTVGTHDLRWRYSKNTDTVGGSDRAWLDEIVFTPLPPTVTSQPASQLVDEGTVATFTVGGAGQGPFTYQWLFNGLALNNAGDIRGARSATLSLSNVQPSQAGGYSVVVANIGGNLLSANATLTVTPAVPLGEALDAPQLTWITPTAGVGAAWFGQPVITLDGFDAARSGNITHGQTTSFETRVQGPGTISFWWKVSCETNNDRVAFFVNGTEQARISGEVEWSQRTFIITNGAQTLRWSYTKSSSVSLGADRAWVDRVEFAPLPVSITAQPLAQIVDEGSTAFFAVTAEGAPPFSYQWQMNGTNLIASALVRGVTNATLTLSNVSVAQGGGYSVLVNNLAGGVASSNALLQVNTLVPLATALDTAAFTWTTSGTPPWAGQTAVSHDGVDAARSGRIGDSQTTSFQTTVVGPGTVSFWWKVSSESSDQLRLYINGSQQLSLAGEVDWTWRALAVSNGNQIIEWRYVKNSSLSAGQDRGWVDQFLFVPNATPTAPMIAIQPTNRIVVAPTGTVFAASATGSSPLAWQWFFNGTLLTNGNGISGATTTNLALATTSDARAGNYSAVVTNASGSATSAVATLAVITAPIIVAQPASLNAAQSSTVNFFVSALGTPALSYQWRRDGTNLLNAGNLSGVTTTNLRLTAVTAAQAGDYAVVVSNSFGSVTSVLATLIISAPPAISSHPASRTGVAGQSATFSVSANGSAPLTYQWRFNGLPFTDGGGISGATSPTLVRANLQPAAAGVYSVLIANAVGVVVSSNATLSVLVPPSIVVQPTAQSVPQGRTVALTVGATGTFPLSYQWQRDGSNVVNGSGVLGANTTAITLSNAQPEQSGFYSVIVSNVAGVAVSTNVFLEIIPPLTLAESVNAPYLQWLTPTNGWFVQTNVSHDGEAAAQSGFIGHANETSLETTVTGPGTVRFWWKVSSQTNADTLKFFVGNAEWAQISGEQDWQKLSFNLPPGAIPLRWTYAKNSNVIAGLDRAWLDEFDFVPNSAPAIPVILTQPTDLDVAPGATVTLGVEALGTAPLIYQWRFEGQTISDGGDTLGANSPTLRLFNATPAQSGQYDCTVRNNYGLANSDQVLVNVATTVPLNVALDTDHTNFFWRSGGFSQWRGQTATSYDQLDAAQSSPVGHSSSNWIQTTIDGGPLAIAFWWKVSSEANADRLRFMIDGVEAANISGEVGWQRRSFALTNLSAVVRWEYNKNASGSAGLDRGWVDKIETLHISPLITNSAPDTNIVDQGTTARFKVEASGTQPLAYQWRYGGTNLLPSAKVIGVNTSKLIVSNAQPNQTGFYTCQVGNQSGVDVSGNLYLRVLPAAPIGPAVNATNLVWETGGFSWFVGTTDDSHNDNQSVRNGYVDNGHSTWMRTTVVGPGTLRYWWRTSTQPNADFLRFLMNGVMQVQISGNVSWQQQVVTIPPGPTVVQWEYAKDFALTNGSDRVWVDDVSFIPAPPSFLVQPVSHDAESGSTVTFTPLVTGGIGLKYRWRFNGLPLLDGGDISGATNMILRITNMSSNRAGTYSLLVTNLGGTATSSNTVLTFTPVLPLADALDTTGLTWVTGSPGWIGQPIVKHDLVDAARNQTVNDHQSAVMQTTITGPGTINFWWKSSSETNGDALILFVNNAEQARLSGEMNWEQRSFLVGASSQTVKFTYQKNASGKSGQDRGWVDEFSFTPQFPSIVAHPVGQNVEVGTRVTFTGAAIGTPPLTYAWLFNGAVVTNGPGVTGANTTTLVVSNAQVAQSGTYALVVSNSSGFDTSAGALLGVTPLVSLAAALDGAGLVWATNTSSPWVGQQVVTHDGTDAARTGTNANNGSNMVQTILVGPGGLGFWWKVSSETNNDKLIFTINGVEQARISGEVNWEQKSFLLGSGSQTCRWVYLKNATLTGGQDRAWLDEVSFSAQAPSIAEQPVDQNVDLGATASFRVTPDGTPPFTYQWLYNGVPLANSGGISGVTSSNLVLTNVPLASAGSYRVIVSNPAGSVPSSIATLAVFTNLSLALALDTTGLPWTTNGAVTWIGNGAMTHDGVDAARSPALAPSASAWFQTTVTGMNTVSFWWKVSSEPANDRLRFLIDGNEQQNISGEVDWQWRVFNIAAGSHALRWEYVKNGSVNGGLDRAWVDQVVVGPLAPVITAQPTNRVGSAGANASFNATAVGSATLTYRWRFNGLPLADGLGISGSATPTLTVANVQSNWLGNYSVLVSNALGTVISTNAALALTLPVTLSEALDNFALTFTPGGTAGSWMGQTGVSSDGQDAAQTGVLGDSTYTFIKANVTGPGTLTFWWKVSSEADHDWLRFMVDAIDQTRISGEVDWTQITYAVPSGAHEMQWRFSHNSTGAAGQDRGWLDQVAFSTGGPVVVGTPPSIQIQPSSLTVDEGATTDFSVAASGTGPLNYRWLFNTTNRLADGGNIGGATTVNLTLFNTLLTQGGDYSVILSNAAGSITSLVARLTVNPVLSLAEAIDQPTWDLLTDGNALWEGHTVVTHDGQHAARSGMVSDGQSSTLQTIIDGPGALHFWWRVSSETNADVLVFAVNGQTAALISGESDWQEITVALSAGPQFVDWTYFKNATGTAGTDRGWLDQVSFTPDGAFAPAPKVLATGAITPRLSILANAVRLEWTAQTRKSYEVFYKDDLADAEWTRLDGEVLAKWSEVDGKVRSDVYHATVEDLPAGRTRFYQILEY